MGSMTSVAAARRSVCILVVLVIVAVIAWYLRRGSSAGMVEAPAVPGRAPPPATAIGAGHPTEAQAPRDAAAIQRSDARAKRDALREQIARQLAQRPAAASTGSASPPAALPSEPPSGQLRNRLGSRQQLVEQLNHDFMPLASECIEQAQARAPQLAGMLTISMETIADEQLGAVVDVADPSPRNNVADPLLLECIRESAFSLSLPPPPTGGREAFEITIPVDASGSGSGSGSRP